MVIYNCEKCKYTTTIKTHYKRHLNTKKHLMNNMMFGDNNKKSIKKVYSVKPQGNEKYIVNKDIQDDDSCINTMQVTQGNTEVTQKYKNVFNNNSEELIEDKNYFCEICQKHFSYKNSYYRHIKHYCKHKIENNVSNQISLDEYKEQQELLIKVLIDSKNEIVASKNELIAEKERKIQEQKEIYKDNNIYQYNDSRQIKDSFNTMNNTNYVINYINYSEADSMENIKDKFKLTREEFIKASLTNGYKGALMEKAENIIIKPYLEAQEKRPMHTVDCSRKKALYKDNSNDNWTFNPKTTLDHCFKTFHLSAINHQDTTIKENPNWLINNIEDSLYKQTYFIPTDNKDKESIYRDVKNHIYKETKVNKNKLLDYDNKLINNIEKILIE